MQNGKRAAVIIRGIAAHHCEATYFIKSNGLWVLLINLKRHNIVQTLHMINESASDPFPKMLRINKQALDLAVIGSHKRARYIALIGMDQKIPAWQILVSNEVCDFGKGLCRQEMMGRLHSPMPNLIQSCLIVFSGRSEHIC